MKYNLLFALALVLFLPTRLHSADNHALTYSAIGTETIVSAEDRSCYICGRTSWDLLALPNAVAAIYRDQLSAANQDKAKLIEDLTAQNSEIMNGIEPQNVGALDFPISTVAKDMPTFSKKIPKLQQIRDYAAKEGIKADVTLLEVLNSMRDGKSRAMAPLEQTIEQLSHKQDILLRLGQELASESFVTIDLQFDEILKVDAGINTPELRALYDNWIRLNKTAINAVRSAYAQYTGKDDSHKADQQLDGLLKTASTATPVILQQALRTRILYELAGSPEGTFRVRVCPICRELFESLNDKITKRYTNKDLGGYDGIFSNYGAR